jgi:D-alanyl-D-alanine carboxypeptidase (penicillin-binding protein 5/6)
MASVVAAMQWRGNPRDAASCLSVRRVALLASVVLLGAFASGCGGGVAVSTPGLGGDGDANARPASMPLQAENGPPPVAPLATPLKLRTAASVGVLPIQDPLPKLPKADRKPPRGGMVADLDSGAILWSRGLHRDLPIASVTKLMTALVVNGHSSPTERVRISRAAVAAQGSRVGLLPLYKKVQLETLLYGLLLPSGNDAAIALAERVGGSVPGFVAMMNAQARALGLRCTRFASPNGFEEVKYQRQANNRSCPHDLAILARAVLDQPRLAKIVRTRDTVRPFPIKGGKLYLHNHNPLLRDGYPGTLGLKTGYTDAAGSTFVGAAERGGHRLVVVLLHSPDLGKQSEALLDSGFRALAGR